MTQDHLKDHLKGRLEDRRLITGAGRYTADRNLPGQLYAHFLRSDRPHAEIISIDAAEARATPGVHAVLTGEDMKAAGVKTLPVNSIAGKSRDGSELIKTLRPALATGKVRFVGEAVVCVIAESAAIAQDAAESIVIDYEDLPHVTRAVDAMKPDAPQLHDNAPGNRVLDYETGSDEAKVDAAIRSAKKVVKLSLYNNRVVANPLETRVAIAHYDAAKDHTTFYSVSQGVNGMRANLCLALGITEDKLHVESYDVGGAFGVRSQIYPEYPVLVVASKLLNRPVKWTGSRAEVFLADEQARDVVTTGELALDENGRFLAMRFSFVTNLGAYTATTGAFINFRSMAPMTGLYDLQCAYGRNQMFVTNTAPMAAYRGAGRPIMSAMLERLVGQAARELGIDQAEIRRRNMIPKDKFPYTLVNGSVYDSGDPVGVLADATRAVNWDDAAAWEARKAAAKKRGRLLGRGMACCIESTAGSSVDEVEMRFDPRGTVTVYCNTKSTGQGHETAFAQVAAAQLGLPMESIRIVEGDPGVKVLGGGSGGSRSMQFGGSAVVLGSREVIRKGMALASKELEAAESDIEFHQGAFRIKGTDRSVALAGLIAKHAVELGAKVQSKHDPTWPNGCHIAEVEVDENTGVIDVLSYVACDDAGNIVNHQLVEGQMHGGLTQGAGQVLGEHSMYDPETGQLLTGSFMDYFMPRAGFLGEIRLLDHPVPTATNPLGAKGCGEAGVTGSLPTLMNAILDALQPAGVTHLDMPCTPARVWTAIQMAKAGKPAALAVPQV
jgi:carbon-monoxide dehydrogenase large subunit